MWATPAGQRGVNSSLRLLTSAIGLLGLSKVPRPPARHSSRRAATIPTLAIPEGISILTACAWPGATIRGALPRPGPAIRSNKSPTVRYSRLTAARSMTSPVGLITATTAVCRTNACDRSVPAGGTVNRLWRSKRSVATPVRGGITIETLSRGVDAMMTSQNRRRDFTPMPRSDAQAAFVSARVTVPPRPDRCADAAPAVPARRQPAATAMTAADATPLAPITVAFLALLPRRRVAGAATMNELQELGPRPRIPMEDTTHRARHRDGVLLLDAAHRHAQVRRLDDHRHAQRMQFRLERLGNLGGQPLLHLQPAGKDIDDAWDLAQADHAAVRNVSHVALAEERQQVMLAEAVHIDVAHDHHLVVLDGEQRAVDDVIDVGAITAREKAERLLNPARGLDEPLAFRILAERLQQLADEFLHH